MCYTPLSQQFSGGLLIFYLNLFFCDFCCFILVITDSSVSMNLSISSLDWKEREAPLHSCLTITSSLYQLPAGEIVLTTSSLVIQSV